MTMQSVTYKLEVDPANLQQLFNGLRGAGTITGVNARYQGMPQALPPMPPGTQPGGPNAPPVKVTVVANAQTQPSPYQRQTQATQQTNFLRNLFEFEAIKDTLRMIYTNSSITNTYMGAMGKMFSAAIDLLLVPFIPLFNGILMGMGLLVEFLVKSGYVEAMSKAIVSLEKKFTDYVGRFLAAFAKNPADAIAMLVKDIVTGILSLSNTIGHAVENAVGVGMRAAWSAFQQYAPQFGKDIADAVWAGIKDQLPTQLGGGGHGNPKEAGATALGAGVLGLTSLAGLGTLFSLASKVPVIGGLFGLGGKAAAGVGGLGMDALGAALPFLAVGGAGVAGGAGANKLAGMAGIHGILREGIAGAGAGVTAGALAGLLGGPFAELTVPGGAAIGGLLGGAGGLAKGVVDEIRRNQQSSGSPLGNGTAASISNSGNTIHLTQNIYQQDDPKKFASDTASTLRNNLGYSLATGSYGSPLG